MSIINGVVAVDGITSLSTKPLKVIMTFGLIVSLLSFLGVIYALVSHALGKAVAGWASIVCIVSFMGGIQLVSLGIIGEYVGKIYAEVKQRPRFIVEEFLNGLEAEYTDDIGKKES